MIEVKAPEYPIMKASLKDSIFLAGSIEMGTAENWQERIVRELEDINNFVIYNPRRDDWDSSWVQSIDNPQFNEQVTWELQMMEKATFIPLYFSPETKAPITLLEFGLHASSGKLIVCCPEGFWRKGNVDIVCERHGVEQVDTLDQLIETTKTRLQNWRIGAGT